VWEPRRNSRNCRNLQNKNLAAAEIAIRYGPKILLKIGDYVVSQLIPILVHGNLAPFVIKPVL
jgi:hypothetical protein